MGEKEGKTKEPDPLREHPLYKELLRIGREDMSINRRALRKYDHLLGSAEVQRRAGAGANLDQLAEAAESVLRAAVRALPEGKRRIAGEAGLCAIKDYENLKIVQRIPLLEALPEKFDMEMFKYYRHEAFKLIFEYLTHASVAKPKQAVPPYKRHPILTKDDELERDLIRFGQRTAELHYAGLVVLFSEELEIFLSTRRVLFSQLRRPGNNPDTTFTQYIFDCYTALFYQSNRITLEEELFTEDHGITDLLEKLGDATPIGPRRLPDDDTLRQMIDVRGGVDLRWQLRAQSAYRTHWQPWYRKHCHAYKRTARDSALVPIVAMSGVIASIIRLPRTTRQKARLHAHKKLASYYNEIDELAPLAGDLSLRQRADAYFDIQGAVLTDRGKKWYQGRIETM